MQSKTKVNKCKTHNLFDVEPETHRLQIFDPQLHERRISSLEVRIWTLLVYLLLELEVCHFMHLENNRNQIFTAKLRVRQHTKHLNACNSRFAKWCATAEKLH